MTCGVCRPLKRRHQSRLKLDSASSRQLNPLQTVVTQHANKTHDKENCSKKHLATLTDYSCKTDPKREKKHSWKKVRQNKGEGNAKNERLTLASAATVFNGKSPSTRQVRVFRDDCSKDNFFGAQLRKPMLTL